MKVLLPAGLLFLLISSCAEKEVKTPSVETFTEEKLPTFLSDFAGQILFSDRHIPLNSDFSRVVKTNFNLGEKIFARFVFREPIGKLGNWVSGDTAVYILDFAVGGKSVYQCLVRSKKWFETRNWRTFEVELTYVADEFFSSEPETPDYQTAPALLKKRKCIRVKLAVKTLYYNSSVPSLTNPAVAEGWFNLCR